jgi:hypothetical protein
MTIDVDPVAFANRTGSDLPRGSRAQLRPAVPRDYWPQ